MHIYTYKNIFINIHQVIDYLDVHVEYERMWHAVARKAHRGIAEQLTV